MKAQEIFDRNMRKSMVQWSPSSFRRTHPTLYLTVLNCINEALQEEEDFHKQVKANLDLILEKVNLLKSKESDMENLISNQKVLIKEQKEYIYNLEQINKNN